MDKSLPRMPVLMEEEPCISTGLTRSGFGRVHSLVHEAEGMENGASDPLVVVEMFAGMGGPSSGLGIAGTDTHGSHWC